MENENNNILPELSSGEELEREQIAPDFLKEDDWWDAPYEESMLDLDDEMVFPEYTIRFNGAKCGPVTGVMCLAGQSGNGKTQTSTLLMSAYLGAQIEGIELIWQKESPKVLYVDTEMEKGNTQLVVARIAKLCDTKASDLKGRLNVMRLRDEEDHAMIWKKILKGIFTIKPDVVFLDGMIDIIGDFNDNKEASLIVRKVMKLADAFQICMWTVMHQNPGSQKMVGHQGSFLERKSTMVLQTTKVADNKEKGLYHFEVENGKQRGQDVIPLTFHMECFELPNGNINAYPAIGKGMVAETAEIGRMNAEEENALLEALTVVISPPSSKNWTEMRDGLKKEMHIGTKKAGDYIQYAVDTEMLNKPINGRYTINMNKRPF